MVVVIRTLMNETVRRVGGVGEEVPTHLWLLQTLQQSAPLFYSWGWSQQTVYYWPRRCIRRCVYPAEFHCCCTAKKKTEHIVYDVILLGSPDQVFWQTFSFPAKTFQQTYQFDSLLRRLFSAESDKGIASVQATERIHHQTQVPDGACFLKQRNQLVLK